MFRSWAGQARHKAESQMNLKTPEKWLDRSTSAKMVESDAERMLALNAPSNDQHAIGAKMGAQAVLAAFAVLAEQNIDINEALRKDQIRLPHTLEEDNDNE
jgi:hypothetical protein